MSKVTNSRIAVTITINKHDRLPSYDSCSRIPGHRHCYMTSQFCSQRSYPQWYTCEVTNRCWLAPCVTLHPTSGEDHPDESSGLTITPYSLRLARVLPSIFPLPKATQYFSKSPPIEPRYVLVCLSGAWLLTTPTISHGTRPFVDVNA